MLIADVRIEKVASLLNVSLDYDALAAKSNNCHI